MNLSMFGRCKPGYVLLLTLVLLAMVAAGLAGVARRSHQASLEANRFEQSLQRKWLERSTETLLDDADALLEYANRELPRAVGNHTLDFDLGHHRIEMDLSDEQAKANINALWSRSDPSVVRATVQELLAKTGSVEQLELRPLGEFETVAAGSRIEWPSFISYEQAIPPEQLRVQLGSSSDERRTMDVLTLWGDGRLRIDRAEPEVLHAVLFPLLSPPQIESLAEATATKNVPKSGDPLSMASGGTLELTDRQREALLTLITQDSACFSVRLRIDDSRRVRTYLAVKDLTSEEDSGRTIRFCW